VGQLGVPLEHAAPALLERGGHGFRLDQQGILRQVRRQV
jgi:hypothetical protein